jgi:predicted nuclease of restriction endonuclease-like RecB superfamily
MFGYGEREDIPGIVFRSSWEANYARYLIYRENGNEISKWTYEPDIIDLGYARYIPDFKVFANGTTEYHEVKGYEREDGMLKIETALSLGYAIVLINEPIYKRIEKEYSGIIDNWEEC